MRADRESRRRFGKSRGRGLAADLARAVRALLAGLGAGLAAHTVAAQLSRCRVAIRGLVTSLGTGCIARVEAEPGHVQVRLQRLDRSAADLAARGVAIRGLAASLRALRCRKANVLVVDGATHIGGAGTNVAVGVCRAELNSSRRRCTDLGRLRKTLQYADLARGRVTLGIAGAGYRALGGCYARLAGRPVVAAKLALAHVAVLIDCTILVARGLADTSRRCVGATVA